jgi:peptide/nickel transport system permease protein
VSATTRITQAAARRVGVPTRAAIGRWPRRGTSSGRLAGWLGLALTAPVVVVALLADRLAPYDPFAIVGPALSPPSATFRLGTDDLGRDVLSAIVHGSRTALFIIVTVAVVVLVIGAVIGAISGYVGGWVDDLLMRATEAVQVLPRFFLALVVLAIFGPGLDRLALVLGLTSWPMAARVVRAEVMTLRERPFVEAARAAGATHLRILRREILPLALPPAVALVLLVAGQAVLIEASLGFLGLGDPSVVSWGVLAANAQRFLRTAWWLAVFPGLAIVITVTGFDLLGAWFVGGTRRRGRRRRPPRGVFSRGR